MVFGDFDSDGDLDILYQDGSTGGVGFGFMRNNGSGAFTDFTDANDSATPFDTFDFTGQLLTSLFVLDYDNDGDDDIVDRDITGGGIGVWQQGSTSGDGHPPQIASTNPADNSTTVSVGANLVVTFTEAVSKGTGNIEIVRVSDGSVMETIAVAGGQVTGSGTTWTVNPSVTLIANTHYAVHFDAGTFVDGDGAIFAGIDDDTTYDFTTQANQPPSGADNTIITAEDTAHVFAASDFGFTDSDSNSFIAVRIATLPLAGTLTNNGVTVTAGQFVSIADINANRLVFTPAGNANGTGYASFTFQVQDDGGAGVDTDASANTLTLNVTAVNDAPVVIGDGTESLAATNEDVANAALTNTVSALFGGQYSDSTDQVSGGSTANAFAGIAVIANGSSAGTGQWQYYNGSTWVDIGAASTAASVLVSASAPLRFLPAADYNGPAPTLTVKLLDASGGALTNGALANVSTSGGSTPYSVGTVVLDHSVTAVNDAPVTTGGSAVTLTTIGEDSAPGAGQTIASLFSSHFSDARDQVSGGSSANAFTGIAVTSNAATAAQGIYQYFSGGVWQDLPAVSTSSAFVLDASTLVRFVPAANYFGTVPGLTVHLIEDSSGVVVTGATADLTTTGGSTPYGAAMTFGITVTSVSDEPAGADRTVATMPGNEYVFQLSDFPVSDPSDSPADTLGRVRIASLPGFGTLKDGATTLQIGDFFTLSDIQNGLVRFDPGADTGTATFQFQVEDSGSAANGGVILDQSANTMTVTVDSPPTIVNLDGDSAAFTEGGAPVPLDDSSAPATVADSDSADFNGGNLTVTVVGGLTEDSLSIVANANILVVGNIVQYDADGADSGSPVDIGTLSGGTGGTPLVVTFTSADATPAAVEALIRRSPTRTPTRRIRRHRPDRALHRR